MVALNYLAVVLQQLKKKFYLLLLLCPAGGKAFASFPFDTVLLDPVTVQGYSLSVYSTANKTETLSAEDLVCHRHENIGQLLLRTSGVHTNIYGPLATISMRGSGSAHTAVIWNGFNLQDVLNGGVNLFSLPVCFADEIQLQYGGGSALHGSGAIGGSLILNTPLHYNKGLSATMTAQTGSFGFEHYTGKLSYSNSKYAGTLRFFQRSAQNHFTFKNTAEYLSPLDTMENAAFLNKGIMTDFQYRLTPHQQLVSHLWLQHNTNEIPSPITQSPAYGKEISGSARATLEWQFRKNNHAVFIRSAFFNEKMTYTSVTDSGNHRAVRYITEGEHRYTWKEWLTIRYGLHYTKEEGGSDHFDGLHVRHRNAFFASCKMFSPSRKQQYTINIREELVNGNPTPLTWSAGLYNDISNHVVIRTSLSRNYRIPDFNALYWKTWGNPALKPESGYNADGGYVFSFEKDRHALSVGQTLYAGIVSNWIIWQPSGNVWHPYNVEKVFSRGLEHSFQYTCHLDQFHLETKWDYALTYATKIKAESNDQTGKQLIYVPHHKTSVSAGVRYKTSAITYYHSFTGMRYADPANTLPVKGFHLGNLAMSHSVKWKRMLLDFHFYINNLWNTSYQVMLWYPMPGRNYMAGITIEFN